MGSYNRTLTAVSRGSRPHNSTIHTYRQKMAKLQLMAALLLTFVLAPVAQAGFRCTVGLCSTSCVVLGQTSGNCDPLGDCHCSERSISVNVFKALLPSRCNLGESFCEGTCNSIGRTGGKCVKKDGVLDCDCDDTFLTPKEFALCAAASTCRLDCQRQGFAIGECKGWKCSCISNLSNSTTSSTDKTLSVEFDESESDY